MHIELEDINKALKFYNITDKNYINKIYKCVEDINAKNNFNKKTESVYNILYNDKSNEIDNLWKIQNKAKLFGKGYNPFVTSVLILLGYNLHQTNMANKNFDKIQKELNKKRVKETLTNDIFIRKLKSVRISQMLWASYFINAKMIEVGRLQFENCQDHVQIHIPAGEKLEIEKVKKSIKNSKKEIEKYFNIKNPKYRCNSWLLSNQINAIINPNSNIAKFYRLFEVKDGPDATRDILNFVFNQQKCNNFNSLKENTSLQKILKQQLVCGRQFKIGLGQLKKID